METTAQIYQLQSQFAILDKVLQYCQHNNKLPNQHDKNKEIASMGHWLSTRKQDQKKGKLDQNLKIAIETKLTEYGFKWEIDQLQNHYDRLEEIVKYCQYHNKLPSKDIEDKENHLMCNWLSTRKLDQKKGKLDKDLKVSIQTKLTDFGFKFE